MTIINPVPTGNGHFIGQRLFLGQRTDDCMRAAVATVLQIDYDETPDVSAPRDDADFSNQWTAWAASRGLEFVAHYSHLPIHRQRWIGVIDVEDQGDDFLHAIVMERDRLFHDPADYDPRKQLALEEVRQAISIGTAEEMVNVWEREDGDPTPPPIANPVDCPTGVAVLRSRGEYARAQAMESGIEGRRF